MRIYLDNCALNRPFDDQTQARIKTETEAVIEIRRRVEQGTLELMWSYVIDYENFKNPVRVRRQGIASWKKLSSLEIAPSIKIVSLAMELHELGLREADSLHIACAIESGSDYFVTTDDGILKRGMGIPMLRIADPIVFLENDKKL